EVFNVVLVFAGVVAPAAETEVIGSLVLHVVLDAPFALEVGAVAKVVIVGLAGAALAAEDAGHMAVAHVRLRRRAVAAADPGDLSFGGTEDEVHRVVVLQAQ